MGSTSRPELWGGIECTVNRVGDRYFDQLERNGHASRAEDLEMLAGLGLHTLRYPVLWERTAPDGMERADWSWADERLNRLRELGIRPIVGLVHHGSGPRHTSLTDPEFPEKLAEFARGVAERYPWVESYTPVNEPLTTARFSGLYGHWYPHGRSNECFARAFINQCRAIVLSMKAIREIRPDARLVQTEDLGKTYSTPALAYQAEFENHRRWMTFDILSGKIGNDHPLHGYLLKSGISGQELEWFMENPSPPDIIGINHYITSERFLDERLERYPELTHGGNGYQAYADVEAVRVLAEGVSGPGGVIRETWDRYRLPIAITEAHLGCTREQQLRWLNEVWEAACRERSAGADVRAVTAWSLLGAYDWNSLLTCADGFYEPGAFDLRAPAPRPTALAAVLRDLATSGETKNPLAATEGWWRSRERLLYTPVSGGSRSGPCGRSIAKSSARPLLITGATGTLGAAFARVCTSRGIDHILLNRQQMDIADPESVTRAIERHNPWGIVNTAGYVRVDDAEREPERCLRENTDGPATLAELCGRHNIRLMSFSSDLVFDGESRTPYIESDRVAPLNVYGFSKAEAESLLLAGYPEGLMIRTSAFFGPWDRYNFLTVALAAISSGTIFTAPDDLRISPTYLPDLVHASLDLLVDGARGIWHLANQGDKSWAEFAKMGAEIAGFDPELIIPCSIEEMGLRAPRPLYTVLGSERGHLMPALEDAMERYVRECGEKFRQLAAA